MVARSLAALDGRYRADEITIGLADENITPYVSRQLQECGIAARPAVGKCQFGDRSLPAVVGDRGLPAQRAVRGIRRAGASSGHVRLDRWRQGPGRLAGASGRLLQQSLAGAAQRRLAGGRCPARPVRQVVRAGRNPAGSRSAAPLVPGTSGTKPSGSCCCRCTAIERGIGSRSRTVFAWRFSGRFTRRWRPRKPCPAALMPTVDAATAIQLTLRQTPHGHRLVAVRSGSDRVAGLARTAAGRRFRAGRVQL